MMYDFWFWLTGNFNNREISIAFWIIVSLILLCIKKDFRSLLISATQGFTHQIFLVLFIGFALYIAALSWVGIGIGLLNSGQTTAVVIWYFVGGLILPFRAVSAKGGMQHFQRYAESSFIGIALFEFIVVFNTFSLLAELFLVLITFLLGAAMAISESRPEFSSTKNLFTWLLGILILFLAWNSISQIWVAPEDFFTMTTLGDFILPIYLTIGSMPFLYALYCYSCTEQVRIRIARESSQSKEVKKYAKKCFTYRFWFRPQLLERAAQRFYIISVHGKATDVNKIICDVLQYEQEKKNPPAVDGKEGWSPYAACNFLAEHNLYVDDYRQINYEGQYSSDLVSDGLSNNPANCTSVFYSFIGVKGLVKEFELQGYFIGDSALDEDLEEFSELATKLCDRAIPGDTDHISKKLTSGEGFKIKLGATTVRLEKEVPESRRTILILTIKR